MTVTRPGKAARTWWRGHWRRQRVRWYVLRYVGRDSHTGLGMRRQGMRLLRRDLSKGRGGAVILCDLDNMLQFNDANGPVLGDELICLVAAVLSSRTSWPYRYGRCCYRLGGDEFLIRLPGKDAQTAYELAEVARERIKRLPAALGAAESVGRPLTAKFAVSGWPQERRPDYDKLMQALDDALHHPARDSVTMVEPPSRATTGRPTET